MGASGRASQWLLEGPGLVWFKRGMPEKSSSTSAPLAVLYLPPLGSHREDELEVLARKMATALDRQSHDGSSRYEVVPGTADLGGRPHSLCRILRRGPGDASPRGVADLYMVDYRETLMARHRGRVLFSRCLLAAYGTLELSRRLLLHLLGSKPRVATRQEVFQTFIVLGGMVLVITYLAILVLSGARLASEAVSSSPGPRPASGPATTEAVAGPGIGSSRSTQWHDVDLGRQVATEAIPVVTSKGTGESGPGVLGRWWDRWYPGAGLLMSLVLASRLFSRDRAALVGWVTRMSEEMLAFVFYLGMGDRRAEVTGLVDDRVEKLLEEDRGYERVAFMGYSFGSIVALDVLFPADDIRARRLDRVDTLVTIGAPVSFILTYWPGYFAGRSRRHAALRSWVNIFSPVDVLATEFDPSPPGPGEVALQPSHGTPDTLWRGPDRERPFREGAAEGSLTWFATLTLLGIRAHEMYWSPEEGHERNCLHLVVPDLFPSEASGDWAAGGTVAGTAPGGGVVDPTR